MIRIKRVLAITVLVFCVATIAHAGVDGSISGTVSDSQGIAVSGAQVQVLGGDGKVLKETTSSTTGEYQFFPITFGNYELTVHAPGFSVSQTTVHIASGANSQIDAQLSAATPGKAQEMVLEVKAKKHLIHHSASVSSTEVTHEQIEKLPQGNQISLPKLLTTTTPGTVPGPFGQVFFRGNHANIQYQIDGVQLPDSPSNTFGQAFSPRNIDHMEVITGGIPAEYGERLAAVVNIVTKSGPEVPTGEAEVNYGSYNSFSPTAMYGGSNSTGSIHYYLSLNYNRTDRGLDTPQPASESNQSQGGKDVIHDHASGNNEFAKVDWLVDNENKLSVILFNAQSKYEIPNYPSNFKWNDPFFNSIGYADNFGNVGQPGNTTFNFVPFNTDDWQKETNSYVQIVWKHTLSERSFFQLAPYYKYSAMLVHNDPANDLATSGTGSTPITGASPSSFAENKKTNNFGLKGDFSTRPDEKNLLKAGFQLQTSRSTGSISVQTDLASAPVIDANPESGTFESVYVQDDYTLSKQWVLNAGMRFDATQFLFSGLRPTDYAFQPRVGVNYLVTDTTKLHAFYGKLFQPAPAENLRDTFVNTGAGQWSPYDIKAEKDDYYEVGVAHQLSDSQLVSINLYYKNAKNMLDDAQLLNTSIAQPYNFAKGYAYGAEFSLKGQINESWSNYANYTYEIAKGVGRSGGVFAFPLAQPPPGSYQFLDHVQVHTANTGIGYSKNHLSWTTEALYGSGLRTGPNNSTHLPGHLTFDTTVGYEFHGEDFWSKWKVSGDILNILDNVYPITVANGFNGSHYAAGRQFFIHLTKTL